MLVLLIGDFHLPHRQWNLPSKFRKLLVPNKMQHVLCTGNLCTRETVDYLRQPNWLWGLAGALVLVGDAVLINNLRSLSSDVHIVRGDFDDESVKGADSKVITIGQFRIGLCHGHQIIPWNDSRMLDQLARQLDVDVLVTGHSHECSTAERDGRFFVSPGSATGAFSFTKDGSDIYIFVANVKDVANCCWTISFHNEVTPAFALMDVQSDSVVTYLYRLINDDVKVERVTYKKTKSK